MAEYCSQCSSVENEFDIDLFRIAIKVKKTKTGDYLSIQLLYKSRFS